MATSNTFETHDRHDVPSGPSGWQIQNTPPCWSTAPAGFHRFHGQTGRFCLQSDFHSICAFKIQSRAAWREAREAFFEGNAFRGGRRWNRSGKLGGWDIQMG